ncbi:uncharacterized protein [Coffea arabica]|uniref:Uncharacterized protein LOC113712638 isoform X3 n=1 Tax=Coffea arabica TaxID=13443 RepID=A0A6P6UNL3_COFAR|nr:uncharacterized protein LOC113712638 isoform X3 [Coffea arabica]
MVLDSIVMLEIWMLQAKREHFFGEGISHVEAKDYDYRGRGQFPGVFTVQPSLETYDKGKDEAEEETDNGEHQYKIGGDNVFASGPINPPPDLYTYVEGGGLSGIDATYAAATLDQKKAIL